MKIDHYNLPFFFSSVQWVPKPIQQVNKNFSHPEFSTVFDAQHQTTSALSQLGNHTLADGCVHFSPCL